MIGTASKRCVVSLIAAKLRAYYPTTGNLTGLEKELQDSMDCRECLPLCSTTNYNVGTASLQPKGIQVMNRETAADQYGLNQLGIVKVYYPQRWSSYYSQDVVSEWFNMMSGWH